MTNDGSDEKGSGFVIDAPSLEYEDDVLYDFHRIEYMPKLERACVDMTHGVDYKFLEAFTTARCFYLCVPFSEVPYFTNMF